MKRILTSLLAICLAGPAVAGPLRLGIWEAAEPYFIRQGDEWTGMCADILRAVTAVNPRQQFVLPTQAMPVRRVEHEMLAGRADLVCGARITAARQTAGMQFCGCRYITSARLAVRADDPVQIRQWDDVRQLGDKGIVLIVQGNSEIDRLQRDGIRLDAGSPSGEQNIRKLLAGRGRFFYARESYFHYVAPKLKEFANVRCCRSRWTAAVSSCLPRRI
jgi:ABC-type amino acid transport substrate-binding protein